MEQRQIALAVDTVAGVVDCSKQSLRLAEEVLPRCDYLKGVIKFKDGLILIHDLDKFLSLEEEKSLDLALSAA